MTNTREWVATAALPPTGTITVLEASAGTGKTYQIGGIATRLVAQEGVSIEKLLVITFTHAATAELRDRVRRRLSLARDALSPGGACPPGDDVIAALCAGDPATRARSLERLQAALSNYDRAPISTIHGFCQRTLDTLAFESGQETGLDVLGEATALRDEIVADDLALLYAAATVEDLAILETSGFTRKNLSLLVKPMTGPVEPSVEPAQDRSYAGPLEGVVRWRAEAATLAAWLATSEAAAGRDAYAAGSKVQLIGTMAAAKWAAADAWLTALAGCLAEGGIAALGALDKRPPCLTAEFVRKNWKKSAEALAAFAGLEIVRHLDAACVARDALCCGALVGFATGVRARFERELARRGVLTYDAMLSRLAERMEAEGARATPDSGPRPLTDGLRAKFDAVLVDEFQDTDEAQWTVLRRAFGEPAAGKRLFLIGDPKQAIYGFRGADLHVYLAAVARAGTAHRHDLDTNFRSDPALVGALNTLWGAPPTPCCTPFGASGIAYHRVKASHAEARLTGPIGPPAALVLRWFDAATEGAEPGAEAPPDGAERPLGKAAAHPLVARLCAAECVRLLSAGLRLPARDAAGTRPVHPGDLAVLVNAHWQGAQVRAALAAVGIPAVAGGRSSVLQSDALAWVRAWLDALAAPANERPARLLAVTPLFGWTAADLAYGLAEPSDARVAAASPTKTPDDWAGLRGDINRWANAWVTRGFARVFHDAVQEHGIYARLLGSLAGERGATDLRHLSELCHAEERRSRLGPGGLSEWLRRKAADAEDGDEEQALRLESDARAVRIVTVHASKGLQYPITLLPYAWDEKGLTDRDRPLSNHSPNTGRLTIDLHPPQSPARAEAVTRVQTELSEEAWRLTYVAMTRAEHRCVAWLGAVADVCSPLTMMVGSRSGGPPFKAPGRATRPDTIAAIQGQNRDALAGMLSGLAELARTPGIAFVREDPLGATTPRGAARYAPNEPDGDLAPAATWPAERRLGANWRVTSYTGLSGGLHVDLDEPVPAGPDAIDDAAGLPPLDTMDARTVAPLPFVPATPELEREACGASLPGGTVTGTWLHAVLEELDFTTGRGRSGEALPDLVARTGRRHGGDASADAEVVRLVPGWLDTPLDGPTVRPRGDLPSALRRGLALRNLALTDRLDELTFDLRLGAGAAWSPARRAPAGAVDFAGRIDPWSVRLALLAALPSAGTPACAASEPPGYASWLQAILGRKGTRALGDGAEEAHARVLPAIAGLLTGSIDLVFRTPDDTGTIRYFVVDYKSNRLLGPTAPEAPRRPRRVDYTLPMLQWEMGRKAYHLQALLYTLALHRMLAQRLGGRYDYDLHVGGHLYLFLKGMEGPDTPRHRGLALGVYADRWPKGTVLALDAALDGADPDRVAAILSACGGAP